MTHSSTWGVHDYPQDGSIKIFRTLQPVAKDVSLLIEDKCYEMVNITQGGVFECSVAIKNVQFQELHPFDYRYRIVYHADVVHQINDPYRFLPLFGENDPYLFNAGTNYSLYNLFSVHSLKCTRNCTEAVQHSLLIRRYHDPGNKITNR